MRNNVGLITCFCLFLAVSFVGPRVRAQEKRTSKIKAGAVMVDQIQSTDIKLPAEFQVALYENLVQQMEKKAGGRHVYREGDRNASNSPDLVVLRSTVRTFKQGSQRTRQVTTIAGETSIAVHCEFVDKQGNVLLERDIQGKVLFFGGNLKATYDFAKKAAALMHENLTMPEPA